VQRLDSRSTKYRDGAVAILAETVAPSSALIVWTLLVLAVLAAGVVTASKGRWGWLLGGVLLAGVPCLISAFLAPSSTSLWLRRTRRRHLD
jgi:hypothetical protein